MLNQPFGNESDTFWKPSSAPNATSSNPLVASYQRPVKSLSFTSAARDSPPPSRINIYSFETRFALEENTRKLQSGTITKIVEWVVFEQNDMNCILNLIHTFKLHTTAASLFDVLLQTYKTKLAISAQSFVIQPQPQAQTQEVKERLATMMKTWFLSNFEADFKKGLWKKLIDFVTTELSLEYSNAFKLLLINKMSKTRRVAIPTSRRSSKASPKFEDIFGQPPELIASQITIIVRKLLTAIQPSEFYNNAWQKKDKEHRAPNLTRAAQYFNQLSYWVCTEILRAQRTERGQVTVLKWFISLAEKLYELYNFDSLMALLSAFSNSSISRLKKLWASIPERSMEIHTKLCEVMEMAQNFKNYRSITISKPRDAPIVPYLALYLRDITFITDGNPDFTEDGLINFEKMLLLGSRIQEIRVGLESSGYDALESDESLQHYLLHLVHWDEDEIYAQSLQCEPKRSNSNATPLELPIMIGSPREIETANPLYSMVKRKPSTEPAESTTNRRKQNINENAERLYSSAPMTIPGFTRKLSSSPPSGLMSPHSSPLMSSPSSSSVAASSFAAALATTSLVKNQEEIPLRSRGSIVRLSPNQLDSDSGTLLSIESFFKEPIGTWVHSMFDDKEILAVLQGLNKQKLLDLTSDALIDRGLHNPFQIARVMWIVAKLKESPQELYEEVNKSVRIV